MRTNNYITYLPLLMSLFSLAALFVYRPQKFKALPWIVLAVMILMPFLMSFWFGAPLLWGEVWVADHYEYLPICISFVDNIDRWFWWIGEANLTPIYLLYVPASPITTLWVVLIVDAIQKKKQNNLK